MVPGRVFQPANKHPRIWRSTCSWIRVVDLTKANQLLKYLPEAVPTLNSMLTCANKMRKKTISCCTQLEKTKTTDKYETHYRGKEAICIEQCW